MSNGTRSTRERGARAERIAAWFLERRGYRVIERNARVGRFEIDLVVERGRRLVFVEVKSRGSGAWARAPEALGEAQRRRLAAAASAYLERAGGSRAIRLDVVTVEENDDRLLVEHYADAFGRGGGLR